jgi:hypothetical protein
MPLIHVDLQEGFEGDPIVIAVNGREAFNKPAVRTRTQIGLADSVELTLPPGDANIEVTARGNTTRFTVPAPDDVYVGISIADNGQIVHRTSREAFGYL